MEKSEDQKSASCTTEVSDDQFCLTDLPTALIPEIIYKMPIKSIMKLKFVWKSLNNILCSPYFATNYAKKSPYTAFLLPNPSTAPPPESPSLCLLEVSDSGEDIISVFKPKIPDWLDTDMTISIVGSCPGLFCFVTRNSEYKIRMVYICNPVRGGECIAVAENDIREGANVSLGFGFCKSTNKYKILRIFFEGDTFEGEILTIGVDQTWRGLDRHVNPTIHGPVNSGPMVSVSETLHWIILDPTASILISTFDIEEEKIGQLSHPDGVRLDFVNTNLTSINNKLCIIDLSSDRRIVLWTMQEYAVADSWTRDMVIGVSFPPSRPMDILENGDMFFSPSLKCYTISYSPTTRECFCIEAPSFGAIDYSPNFLSVKEIIGELHSSTMNVLSET